jgi:bla regulator protein BlaR1
MVTNVLINALGQALFESCGQALLIYVALQIVIRLFPGISSKNRYRMGYFALTAMCGWFLVTLVQTYISAIAAPNYPLFINSQFISNTKFAPTLLQQAEIYISKYAKYITGLYLTGLLLQGFRLAGGLVHINYIRKQKNLLNDSLWSQRAAMLAKTLAIGKKVSLYFSEHVQIPLTIGHLKPIIVFPLALINNLDNDQVEAILLHELAHIKRSDYLLNLLQCIMETILCFNPFAWLLSNQIREEREYCCDDIVVGTDYNNYSYASALFIIAQQNTQTYSLAMASAGSKKYPLLNRIKRLHNMKTSYSLPKFNLIVIIAIAAIGALLAWGIPQYGFAKTVAAKKHKATTHPLDKFATPAPVKDAKDNNIAQPYQKAAAIVTPDTTAKAVAHTKRFKIVIDENGNKREYNSIEELPDSEKVVFLRENSSLASMGLDSQKLMAMVDFTKSPEWQKQMRDMKFQAEAMSKKFNSPEWQKQVAEMQKQGEKMGKKFNSPEWKKQVAEMQKQGEEMGKKFNNPEYIKQMADMQAKIQAEFNSPEYQKQMADMQAKLQAEFNNPEWQKHIKVISMQSKELGKAMSKQFNSPEWKKQMKDIQKSAEKMGKQFSSPEWQKQMEDLQNSIQDEVKQNMEKAQTQLDSVQQATPGN